MGLMYPPTCPPSRMVLIRGVTSVKQSPKHTEKQTREHLWLAKSSAKALTASIRHPGKSNRDVAIICPHATGRNPSSARWRRRARERSHKPNRAFALVATADARASTLIEPQGSDPHHLPKKASSPPRWREGSQPCAAHSESRRVASRTPSCSPAS